MAKLFKMKGVCTIIALIAQVHSAAVSIDRDARAVPEPSHHDTNLNWNLTFNHVNKVTLSCVSFS